MIPEQNIYSEREVRPFAQYLEQNQGEVIGTAEFRMHSTAQGELSQTDEVLEVLEELSKSSYLERVENTHEDRWRISPYAEEEDAMNYLMDENSYDRLSHPLGPDFDESDIKGALSMRDLFPERKTEKHV